MADEVERRLERSEHSLRPAIERLAGNRGYYVGIDRKSGTMTNTSLWESLEDAQAMGHPTGDPCAARHLRGAGHPFPTHHKPQCALVALTADLRGPHTLRSRWPRRSPGNANSEYCDDPARWLLPQGLCCLSGPQCAPANRAIGLWPPVRRAHTGEMDCGLTCCLVPRPGDT